MASGGSTLDENVPPDKHNHQALLDASFGLDIPSQANDETKLKGHSHSFQHAICAQIRETRQKLKALLAQLSSFRCTCLGTNSLSLPDDDYQNSTLGQIDHSSVNDGQGKYTWCPIQPR